MTISTVIVNYNVKHYLDQCLHSVFSQELDPLTKNEVWVVDNNSVDGSLEMVRNKYPQVRLIANADNVGFAKANNQALRAIIDQTAEKDEEHYILILNPDTILEQTTLRECAEFMRQHDDCGALGVKMVNAEGTYLRESKRGFPSPRTSFYKMCGLARLFPHHKRYAAYYMGALDDNSMGEVDILPGAFMFTSAKVLRKVGLFDESYFMYAEDVDLSWRIKLGGFKNYYFPHTRILHYKGECTRKETLSYVYTFYNAMAIFSRHYFGGKGSRLHGLFIQAGIWLRALAAAIARVAMNMLLPVADFLLSLAGFIVIKHLWATYWAANVDYYPTIYTCAILPLYAVILLMAVFFSGGYDKPMRPLKIAQGLGIGAFLLLAFYSLCDESVRYSRAIVLLGSVWTILSTFTLRLILTMFHVKGFNSRHQRHRRYLIVGSEGEQRRVYNLLGDLGIEPQSVITTPCCAAETKQRVDEVVFCAKDIPLKEIIDTTISWRQGKTNFRIFPATDNVLIGSNYTEYPEQLYSFNHNHIASAASRRSKRIFDIAASLALAVCSPLLFWLQRDKKHYFTHLVLVLAGQRTWVGYSGPNDTTSPLPYLRPGILTTRHSIPHVKHPDRKTLDNQYIQNYHVATDLTILLLNLSRL